MKTNQLHDVTPAMLQDWILRGEALVVDVREFDEFAGSRIAGSTLMPLSRFRPHELPEKPGKTTVLVCRSGRRTRDAARQLFATGIAEVHHLEGGLLRWTEEGLPLEKVKGRSPLSVMRQVQITIGSVVLLSSVLGGLVWPGFLLVTAAMGVGLLVAGLTGNCAMAGITERFPWNQVKTGGGSG